MLVHAAIDKGIKYQLGQDLAVSALYLHSAYAKKTLWVQARTFLSFGWLA